MLIKRQVSEGIDHYAYIIASEGEAVVVDPRRDVGAILDFLKEEDLELKYVVETHRNEDILVGSNSLKEETGAEVLISAYEDLGYEYGKQVEDGHRVEFGELAIEALHTPGHTKGHMSYVLYYKDIDTAFAIFTGDCIFYGDAGRTDFYQGEVEEMTGRLYDSIHEKILPLGDQTLIYPAHGPNSVCGWNADERPVSTIGFEKVKNPYLQITDREKFIQQYAIDMEVPRYFERIEVGNIQARHEIDFPPLEKIKLADVDEDAILVDARQIPDYKDGYIPGSYLVPKFAISGILGAFFDPKDKIVVIVDESEDTPENIDDFTRELRRIYFDNIENYVVGVDGFEGDLAKIESVSAEDFAKENLGKDTILDVRQQREIKEELPMHEHLAIQDMYRDYEKLDRDKTYYTLCLGGKQSAMAASYLQNKGFKVVHIIGGLQGLQEHIKDI